MRTLVIAVLKLYRLVVSPLYGNVCRYYPSCSAYALEAVQVHGAVKGGALGARRLSRCHPWNPGGYDPVPGTAAAREWLAEQAMKLSGQPDHGSPESPRDFETDSAPPGHATRCMS